MKELTEKQMEKLKEHSKAHKGGMRSKHMRLMVKFMREGMSFSVAHKKVMKIDKDDMKKKPMKKSTRSY